MKKYSNFMTVVSLLVFVIGLCGCAKEDSSIVEKEDAIIGGNITEETEDFSLKVNETEVSTETQDSDLKENDSQKIQDESASIKNDKSVSIGSESEMIVKGEEILNNEQKYKFVKKSALEKNEGKKMIIKHTDADKYVVPDIYSTGCKGELIKVSEGGTYDGLPFYVDNGVAKINIMSKSVEERTVVEGYDFTAFDAFTTITEDKADCQKYIKFVNCKFSEMRTARSTSKLTVEFENCSFYNFNGSSATFNKCYFGGTMKDCTNPFQNCTYNDCMFADISFSCQNTCHTDAVQIYGYKGVVAKNIKFINCRMEVPRFKFSDTEASNTVNTCIGLMLDFNDAENISWEHCVINGGGYSIYLQPWKGHTFTNISLKDIKVGCSKAYGILYKDEVNDAEYINVRETDSLYVGSVWKDSDGIHLSVTNDTNQERKLMVYTDKGWFEYIIEPCKLFDEVVEDETDYDDMPFDIDVLVEANSSYVVCYDTTNDESVQIRMHNWDKEDVYAYNYSKYIGNTVVE